MRPSWAWLGLVGLIGGAPTFLGSMLGYSVTSEPLELAFYAVSGGAILYVIGEVWNAMRRYGHRELGLLMLSVGFLCGGSHGPGGRLRRRLITTPHPCGRQRASAAQRAP